MDRRTFLRALSIAAATGLTLDLDKLLWLPGAKIFFLPEPKSLVPIGVITAFAGPIPRSARFKPIKSISCRS